MVTKASCCELHNLLLINYDFMKMNTFSVKLCGPSSFRRWIQNHARKAGATLQTSSDGQLPNSLRTRRSDQ